MRVSYQISTGTIIEGQSNDAAPMDALVQNAINAGYAKDDIGTKIMPDADFFAAIKAQNPPVPTATLQDLATAVASLAQSSGALTSMPASIQAVAPVVKPVTIKT